MAWLPERQCPSFPGPSVLNSQDVRIILDSSHPADSLSLYIFYYGYARAQKSVFVDVSLDDLSDNMDWKISKIIRTKRRLLRLGSLEEIQQGKMKGRTKVGFDWSELKEDIDPSCICPSGYLWGTDLGRHRKCHECKLFDECVGVCLDLEGEEGINQRDVFFSSDDDEE